MRTCLILVVLFSAMTLSSCKKSTPTVTIGYQIMANPWKVLLANKSLRQHTKSKLDFRKFDSGGKVIAAMASGSLDIAVLGSSPIATALSNGIDMKVIWVMAVIGDSEAFVARTGTNIKTVKDLKGKKVAVPFGSTTHYHLLLALQKAGVKENEVKLLNMEPPSIAAAWKTKAIDAAFVWGAALEEIKKTGSVFLTSKQLAAAGNPTFDAMVVRTAFLKKNRAFVVALLSEINKLHRSYNAKQWTASSPETAIVAKFVGSKPDAIATSLAGYSFPDKAAQLSSRLLGKDVATALKKTSQFLKEQKRVNQVLGDYSKFVDATPTKDIK